MSSVLILFIALTIIFPSLTYIVTENFISTSIVLLFTGLYLFLYAYQRMKKSLLRNKNFHSCYTFINSFIVSISVNGSLLAAFESTKLTMDREYVEMLDGLINLNEIERLDYLKKYYDFDVYYLFLTVINIWVEQGGDIFKISHYLNDELRRNEEYLIKCENITRRKSVEFSLLWMFTLLILLILRFTLSSFYLLITRNLLFQIAVVALFLLLLLSLHFMVVRISRLDIKEYGNA